MNKLRVALIKSGWTRVETSAYVIEAVDIAPIWRGIELCAKQAQSIGQVSALTFHIQLWDPAETQLGALEAYHPKAVAEILDKDFPA